MAIKKVVGRPGARRANIHTRRFLAARAAALGSVAALAREIRRPEQTLGRVMNGDGLQDATADDYRAIIRQLGFLGETGLEPRTIALSDGPSGSGSPPPAAT